jgi:hypothetical protein
MSDGGMNEWMNQINQSINLSKEGMNRMNESNQSINQSISQG